MEQKLFSPIEYKTNDIVSQRYRIIRKAGKGGMNSTIYLAEDTKINDQEFFSLQKNVAIKVINKNEKITDDEWVKFLDECFTNTRVKNKKNIVNTFEILKENGGNTIIIVMEFVDGISLRQHINTNGCLSVKEAVYYFANILEGVKELHGFQRKIIHRDLKPENILLSKDLRQVKIIDFGISSVFETTNDGKEKKIFTNEKNLYGTYPYICPDIFNVNSSKNEKQKMNLITEQFDFYSLGVIFYEMLMGEKPFYSEDYTKIDCIKLPLTYDIPEISNINPNIPPYIENIIFRCLASKPEDIKFRFKSINDIITLIKTYEERPEVCMSKELLKKRKERTFQAKTSFNVENQKLKEKFYEKSWFYWLFFSCSVALLAVVFFINFIK